MDAKKLEKLRQKYPPSDPGASHHAEFKRVVEKIFAGTDRRPKPFEGVSTFIGAPLRAAGLADLERLDVALLGVPLDLGVTCRPGARFGPRAVRGVERIGPFHHVHRMAPLFEAKVADVGDVPFRSRFSLAESIADIEAAIAKITAASVVRNNLSTYTGD